MANVVSTRISGGQLPYTQEFFGGWEEANNELAQLQRSTDPEDVLRANTLARILAARSKVRFRALLSLLPFEKAGGFAQLRNATSGMLPNLSSEMEEGLKGRFGSELAT